MPKERFHLYLADELLTACTGRPPLNEICTRQGLPFYIGAISPDIFFYDLPVFSLSPLGDELHALMGREGVHFIYDWFAQILAPTEAADHEMALWCLGFASHFLADEAWHPIIEVLSRTGLSEVHRVGEKFSEIECHRLLESEIESYLLAGSSAPEERRGAKAGIAPERSALCPLPDFYNGILKSINTDRSLLLRVAGHYRSFLDFAGLGAGVSEKRILRCCLWQNYLLRLFANKTLGRKRDILLSLPATRYLGVLVTPARTFLPDLFSRIYPEDRNPFSNHFLNQALTSMEVDFCPLAKRMFSDNPLRPAD